MMQLTNHLIRYWIFSLPGSDILGILWACG